MIDLFAYQDIWIYFIFPFLTKFIYHFKLHKYIEIHSCYKICLNFHCHLSRIPMKEGHVLKDSTRWPHFSLLPLLPWLDFLPWYITLQHNWQVKMHDTTNPVEAWFLGINNVLFRLNLSQSSTLFSFIGRYETFWCCHTSCHCFIHFSPHSCVLKVTSRPRADSSVRTLTTERVTGLCTSPPLCN